MAIIWLCNKAPAHARMHMLTCTACRHNKQKWIVGAELMAVWVHFIFTAIKSPRARSRALWWFWQLIESLFTCRDFFVFFCYWLNSFDWHRLYRLKCLVLCTVHSLALHPHINAHVFTIRFLDIYLISSYGALAHSDAMDEDIQRWTRACIDFYCHRFHGHSIH